MTQRRFCSYLLLLVYATSLLLVVPPHFDVESASGSGNVQIASHEDADNCKHISIPHSELCAVCSSVAGRAILNPAPFMLEVFDAVALPQVVAFSSSYLFAPLTSLSRRGPPVS
jgi:hypothetical protein